MFMGGCGSSEPEAMDQPSTGAPSAGAAASPASPAGSAAGAGAGATSVMCGAMMCTNPAASFLPTLKMFMPNAMLATPCCLPSGGCGWVGTGGECTAPPEKGMCPAPSIPGFSALTGCCIESSQTCGIDASALGQGCMMPMFGGGARTRCDGTPVAPPTTGAAGAAAGAAGMSSMAAGASGAAMGAAGGGAAGMGAAGASAGAAGAAGRAAAGSGATTAGRGAGSAGTSGAAGRAGSGSTTMSGAGAGGR